VNLKVHLNKEDAKSFISENKILTRYHLVESKTFRIVTEEDFPYSGISLENLKKSSQVKFAKNTKYRFFKNWDIFECRKEFEIDPNKDVNYIKPSTYSNLILRSPFNCFGESKIDKLQKNL
jgi:hypothetical protein